MSPAVLLNHHVVFMLIYIPTVIVGSQTHDTISTKQTPTANRTTTTTKSIHQDSNVFSPFWVKFTIVTFIIVTIVLLAISLTFGIYKFRRYETKHRPYTDMNKEQGGIADIANPNYEMFAVNSLPFKSTEHAYLDSS